MVPGVRIDHVEGFAYRVPTDYPEADGTLSWTDTTLVLARVAAGGTVGVGYSYADRAAAALIDGVLAAQLAGCDALDVPGCAVRMARALRNLGRGGLGGMALSAVDTALWDLKARLLDLPLCDLLGRVRQDDVPAYGSGGFTSYDEARLARQLAGWVAAGLCAVKMKVGSDPDHDPGRVRAARGAIGPGAALYVDANGAYERKQALAMAERFADEADVTWFEEPVSSDDLAGLRLIRDRAPPGMAVAAGEYGDSPVYFRRMLESGAVDVIQADATRCGGVSGFLKAAALAEAFGVALSAHTAPALHGAIGPAVAPLRNIEFFHDHVRLERLAFDGGAALRAGGLAADRSRPGLGLEVKWTDIETYRV
jgi:L-alanine-DL-glutamate epimerase-like enolase superfamily enzyme